MAIICLDTQILIWGIRQVASDDQKSKIEIAKCLLSDIEKKRDTIIVPSIAYGELLVGVPNDTQQSFMQIFIKKYIIVPFDALAAYHYSQIYKKYLSEKENSEVKAHGRVNISADIKIMATAIACNAKIIYSDDIKFVKLDSLGFIPVMRMPLPAPQMLSLMSTDNTTIQ
jgi:predicted nucleic acid-binding protein